MERGSSIPVPTGVLTSLYVVTNKNKLLVPVRFTTIPLRSACSCFNSFGLACWGGVGHYLGAQARGGNRGKASTRVGEGRRQRARAGRCIY